MMLLPDWRVRQRDYLLEIARELTQLLEPPELLLKILRYSGEMLAGQAGLIALRGEEGGWNIAVSFGISPNALKALSPTLADVPDHEDPAKFEVPEISRMLSDMAERATSGLLSGVGLPLIARNRVLGIIYIFRNYQGKFSQNDVALLQSFAYQAAVAVSNAQIYTEMNHEKQRMTALLDAAADGILIMRPDHTIERANPAFARLMGQHVDDIQGMTHDGIIRWSNLEHGLPLEEAEAGGWPLTSHATLYVEGDLKRPDHSLLPVGITYAPLLGRDKNLINIIASVRDITHFREAEELKSTFISVVSHELKTPVALIKGYVGTLRRDDARWDRHIIADSLEVIEDEADRLAEMIENLLDATRLEAGVLAMNSSDIAMPAIAERLAERFQTQTDKHEIRAEFPEDFPIVLGDEDRLAQVLYNLLSNAIKYSPKGGEIVISGEERADKIIVCVRDHGPGLSPRDIPHIFDRFYRAEEAQRKTQGAGLGLYLARAVIEAHHGSIWVDPGTNDGARFCFSLPRQ
jgi:PAS domain S-box-containing protein